AATLRHTETWEVTLRLAILHARLRCRPLIFVIAASLAFSAACALVFPLDGYTTDHPDDGGALRDDAANGDDRTVDPTSCVVVTGEGNGDPPATLVCNGQTLDVQGSTAACGACDHDCVGGPCLAGVCGSKTVHWAAVQDEIVGPAVVDGGVV